MKHILGISAFYHDSAACLLRDGEIVAAAQEERFTRKKNDPAMPKNAILYCLHEGGIGIDDLDAAVFYDKPFTTFDRLLETYFAFAPRGVASFTRAMPVWLKEKLFQRQILESELKNLRTRESREALRFPLLFSEHHQSHAASAFFPSPFQEAAVLCMDGVGEWATTSAWMAKGGQLEPLWEQHFPHSLGLLYSAFTMHAGFKVNSGEYKLMGLAPYGHPIFERAIREHLIDIKDDGTYRLDQRYFDYCTGLKMTNENFERLFGGPARKPESPLTQREMDLAASVQAVTEEIVLRLSRKLHTETGAEALCLAGGVALNCVANGRLLREGPFKKLWIQPAAGDAGGAIGCALAAWHQFAGKPRTPQPSGAPDAMKGALLGLAFDDTEIGNFLTSKGLTAPLLSSSELCEKTAKELASGKVVGWFQGRMEFGPRALGNRSILADPRSGEMQSKVNLKIKFRESFRPFAPSVLAEYSGEWFEESVTSPYMLLVSHLKRDRRVISNDEGLWGIDRLKVVRSQVPAITHVDFSARLQTVSKDVNPLYHQLISEFDRLTGCPMLLNTSFNIRGEPLVCSPEDAWNCFRNTDIDLLALGNRLISKEDLTRAGISGPAPRTAFELD